ncbi:MAG: hypothetical protein ACOYN6_15680 [Ignavibacteria bacterium]
MIKTELTVHINYGNEQALEVKNVLNPYYLLISFNDIHYSIYNGVSSKSNSSQRFAVADIWLDEYSSNNLYLNQINKFIQQ